LRNGVERTSMNVKSVLAKDAIPSIDDPDFGDSYIGDADDEVLVLEADRAKAYPIRILNFHEIVNDRIDGNPVAVTWCPLCASAVVYDRTVEGRELTFGVSGKLADDDLVMYDRETGSEWKQSLGECIAGEFEGTELTVRPAGVVTWETFTAEYPDGVVLQPAHMDSEAASDSDEPAPVEYEEDPYREYFESDGFGLGAHRDGTGRTWDREDLSPKTPVLGLERDGTAIAYPETRIRDAGGLVEDTVAGTEILVVASDDGLHAYEHPGHSVERTANGELSGDGTVWNPATGRSEDGRRLTRVPSQQLFAFAWQDDHGPAAFYTP
jgi:hypothetical protein